MKKELNLSIRSGLAFLIKEQNANGGFSSFTSEKKNAIGKGIVHDSTFPASLIASSLRGLDYFPESKMIREKAIDFLLGQKSDFWSFNYWERGSSDSIKTPYPDDLDCTFCSLLSIFEYDKKAIKGKDMGKIVTLLTATEKKEGGPYMTWLVPGNADKAWKDVDLAVNSNVASFLATQDIYLDSISSLVEAAVRKKDFSSPYYYSEYSVIYFISRFYRGKCVKKMISKITSHKRSDGGWGNVLETGFCVSALLNFGCSPDSVRDSIGYLLDKEKEWKSAYPFVVELVKDENVHYSGAPALTTAFVLEALGKYRSADDKSKSSKSTGKNSESKRDAIHERIIKKAIDIFPHDNEYVSGATAKQIRKMNESHCAKNITLLPYEFHESLKSKIPSVIKPSVLDDLGIANLLGWVAYSAYDDFYDGEGDVSKLPAANLCLLELSSVFMKHAGQSKEFVSIFREIMTSIEEANLWEMENCRVALSGKGFRLPMHFPRYADYSKLADRSMGHALGPIAIVSMLGRGKKSPGMKGVIGMFRSYIIAKQLNDDAHDWEEDVMNGRLTPVVSMILKAWRKNNKSRAIIDLSKDIKAFQEIFWYETIKVVCKEILFHAAKARECLASLDMIKNKDFFIRMIEKEENSAKSAIEERGNTMDFISSFEE